MRSISRRAVTAALAAMPVAAIPAGAAVASEADDAELFRLEAEFKEAYQHWLVADEDDTAAAEELEEAFPYPALPSDEASDETWAAYFKARDAYFEESDRRGINRDAWRGLLRSVDAVAEKILAIPLSRSPASW